MSKAAVVFPGIGYHADKPLLYYSRKIALQKGYDIIDVPYENFPRGIKGSEQKMREAFLIAHRQTQEMLGDVDFSEYEDILFISKSVGTAVAGAYAAGRGLKTRNIFYTPLEISFQYMKQPGIVFTGTADPWVSYETVREGCRKSGYPLFVTEGADHSLETGNVPEDIRSLMNIMDTAEKYIAG